jgi:hypothetical protein
MLCMNVRTRGLYLFHSFAIRDTVIACMQFYARVNEVEFPVNGELLSCAGGCKNTPMRGLVNPTSSVVNMRVQAHGIVVPFRGGVS